MSDDHIPERDRLPEPLVRELASRAFRMHHYLWHQIRNSWARYPGCTRERLKELGWEPPRVHQDWDTNIVLNNHAGEDFLYMHRRMVLYVNQRLKDLTGDRAARVVGWSRLPEPGDPEYPVPPVFCHPHPFLNELIPVVKTDEYYEKKLLFWEDLYQDPGFLRSVTLGELGSRIEATIHDAMHMRWSSPTPVGLRRDPDATKPGPLLGVDPKWDDPRYDFLGDEYSAHVHPIFWKIHGWVDDRISDWMIANGVKIGFHTTMVEPHWLGTWEGVVPPEPGPHPGAQDADAQARRAAALSAHAASALAAAEAAASSPWESLKDHGEHGDHNGHPAGEGGGHGHGGHLRDLERAMDAVLRSGVIHHMYSRTEGR